MEYVLKQISNKVEEKRKRCGCPSVLIVEDDEFVRIINRTILVQLGFEVKDVTNGKLAVEAVIDQEKKCKECEGFLVILMDYDMPVMNGVEVNLAPLSFLGNKENQGMCK